MKTQIIPIIGDPIESLLQLGIREAEAFKAIEDRTLRLLSANAFIRQGQDIITRARNILRKKDSTYFDKCILAYCEGMGIDPVRYYSFISLFELAAHYGQAYPELKGLLPGCTSLFQKVGDEFTHTRLLDFPLVGLFETSPRLYYWQREGLPALLNYSCEGLAPLFFQGVHGSGMSFALHHKPGQDYHRTGQSIFEMTFEVLFATSDLIEFKKEIKRRSSMTKWSLMLMDSTGQVLTMDIDGPAIQHESYNLNETPSLIFTNVPIQKHLKGLDSYLRFCDDRQNWLKEKLNKKSSMHILDLITDVEDQKTKKWNHPSATLTTVGAWHANLTKGMVEVKEGEGALVSSDSIVSFSLADQNDIKVLRPMQKLSRFEEAWKRASFAQSAYDQGHYDLAYHELQMAQVQMPHTVWKEILGFFLCVWEFKFVSNLQELSLVYKNLKKLKVPPTLKDQWLMLCHRFEKRLGLVCTVTAEEISPCLRELFEQELAATKPVFATWMKLLYPRMEIMEVFSPHHK